MDVGIDLVLLLTSVALAVGIATDFAAPARVSSAGFGIAIASSIAATIFLFLRGLYSTNPRYLGLHDFLNIASVCAAYAIPFSFLHRMNAIDGVQSGALLVPVLVAFLSTTLLSGLRIIRRARAWRPQPEEKPTRQRRILIAGAGDAGETILRELSRGRRSTHHIVGFVDDHPEKHSLRIHGVPVMGQVRDIPTIVARHDIDEVVIAMPSAQGAAIRRVFDLCTSTSARVKTLPGLNSILEGQSLAKHLRDVEIEDLLRREPVKTNMAEISRYLAGEHVLITGGGGSIGSELARQVARIGPASIILVGKGENSIYEIEQELIQAVGVSPITQVADVRDRDAMERIFAKYRPTVVFHAAAHKHVPLMQKNPSEAIHNNILGTLVTSELAVKYGVKKFILISTDKAVNPSSVMGATKRVCEMIVSGLGQATETQFSSVRFGNVLGSRGSLIPLLKAQIRRGGPVTITHKDMTRFFMTIPEAVQLVTQAGSIGASGETFILDMGEAVRIEDLALELIRLHGLMPGDDIEVRYTGMRPGEKMHEELVYAAEDLRTTNHPKIRMVADQPRIDLRRLRRNIDQLIELCGQNDEDGTRQLLMDLAWGKLEMPLLDPQPNDSKTFAR
ncbi:MAG: polysaccharide biosynthesis protein [Fimbriimonas sp.]